MHLAYGCINIFYRGCIYSEILDMIIVFSIFLGGGAFAPHNLYLAPPLAGWVSKFFLRV